MRDWISIQESRAATDIDPDLNRMIGWARDRLVALESFLDQIKLADELRARKLFPEVDELDDPLGEPPPER